MPRSQLMVYKRDSVKNFELAVIKNKEDCRELVLYKLLEHLDDKKSGDKEIVSICWGPSLLLIENKVLSALSSCGYELSAFSDMKGNYYLKEEEGVRLGLLFWAVKPLKKERRVKELADAVGNLSVEEAYYWYSKCIMTDFTRRARRAFRILYSKE